MSAAEQLEDGRSAAARRADGGGIRAGGAARGAAGQAPPTTAPAAGARALCGALPWPRSARLHLAHHRGNDDADRAGRGAAHDRLRLHARRHRDDQQLFQRDARGRGGAGGRQCCALLPRHDHRRAHRRRYQARRVRASDLAVAGLLRFRTQRRTGVAAHRRHHADQVGGRRFGLDRAAQSSCCSSARPP